MANLPLDRAPGTPVNTLDLHVTVRRAYLGSLPYQWEVNRGGLPLHVSSDRFRSMAAAYEVGQSWLAGYIASQQPVSRRRYVPDAASTSDFPSFASPDDEDDELDAECTIDGHYGVNGEP